MNADNKNAVTAMNCEAVSPPPPPPPGCCLEVAEVTVVTLPVLVGALRERNCLLVLLLLDRWPRVVRLGFTGMIIDY